MALLIANPCLHQKLGLSKSYFSFWINFLVFNKLSFVHNSFAIHVQNCLIWMFQIILESANIFIAIFISIFGIISTFLTLNNFSFILVSIWINDFRIQSLHHAMNPFSRIKCPIFENHSSLTLRHSFEKVSSVCQAILIFLSVKNVKPSSFHQVLIVLSKIYIRITFASKIIESESLSTIQLKFSFIN